MRPAIEVTQADREAAAAAYAREHSVPMDCLICSAILAGEEDCQEIVQRFARHRLAEREAAFADGFSAALQGAEAAIWEVEDDAFLYPTVSDALQEVIAELQEMESNWTKRSSVNHRHAVQAEAQLAEREAVVKWLRKLAGVPASALEGHPPRGEVWVLHRSADAIEAGEHRA